MPTLGIRLRSLGTSGRRMRRGWSRERLMEVMRTLVYVLPLTLLIWVWAQDQQIDVRVQQNVPIRIEHVDAGRIVTVLGTLTGEDVGGGGGTVHAMLTFQGPRIGLNSVMRAIVEDPSSALLEIRLRRDPGEATISLRDELNQVDVLRDAGVTIREATPPYIAVRIEQRQQSEARIIADNVSAEDLAGPVVFEPPSVILTGPASVIRTMQQGNGIIPLHVELPTDAPPGEPQEVPLTIVVPNAAERGIRPEVVEVVARFTRREQREERLALSFPVPVYESKPAALNLMAEGLTPVITGLRVRGPAHLIGRLRNPSQDDPLRAQLRAFVDLDHTDEARVGEQVTRGVRLELPPGVELDGEPATVTFTIRKIDSV